MDSLRVSPGPEQDASSRDAPGGSAWERIDRATLQLVAHLFPAETRGQTFFARFIERASREQSIIPDVADDTIYICTQSIATLGQELSLPNETAHKYVKLYMALGLLRKQKFMGRLAFLLSIGIYHPPATLESNLDFLIAHSRPKLRSMAADVKTRCKLYGLISQDLITSLELLCALLQPKGSSRHLLEQQMTQAQALASSLLANLLKRGALPDASAPALTPVRELVARSAAGMQNLPGRARVVDTEPGEPERESTKIAQPGRHAGNDASPNPPDAAAQVDSVPQVHGLESTRPGSPGRRLDGRVVQNLPKPPIQVDSSLRDRSRESTQTANPGRFPVSSDTENLPTQPASVDSQGLANVNVGNVITSNINVNVEIVAAFLCRLFNEPASKKGIYSRLFRDGCNQAEAIHAAAIFALVHFHRDKTIENPAAVFIARCKAYHAQGVPEEAASLLVEYGDLTYQQLLDKVQRDPSQTMQPSALARAAPPGWSTPPMLPILPKPTDLAPRIPLKPGGGMMHASALRLRSQVAHDRRVGMCRTGIAALSDGTYAVLLDNTVSAARVRQAVLYTADEWQARSQEVCATLFASSGGRELAKRRFCVRTPETKGSERS